MKRLFTTALACAFAVSLAAPTSAQDDPATQDQPAVQEPAQDPAPAPEPAIEPSDDAVGTSGTAEDTPASTAADAITVAGCLSGSDDNWQLTNASKVPASSTDTSAGASAGASTDPGAPGAGSTAAGAGMSADASGTTYKLETANNDELKPHVGHKIEVTGTVDHSAMASADTSSSDQPVGTGGAGDAASAKKLNVTSVKMVSGSCE